MVSNPAPKQAIVTILPQPAQDLPLTAFSSGPIRHAVPYPSTAMRGNLIALQTTLKFPLETGYDDLPGEI
jgi:hypothetical protein